MNYPIDELLPDLLTAIENNPSVVLQAAPGAGKTTRVPLALLPSDFLGTKKIIMLEPRKVAARAAARFMAKSLGEPVGHTVGYRVRLDSKISHKTRIEVVTEGVLTRLVQNDPMLEEYGIVIFDEFHERSLNSDLGLALCLDAQEGLRPDLRLLVMSATLDGSFVAKLLGDAPILKNDGRSYPVAIHYRPLKNSFLGNRRGFLAEISHQILIALSEEKGSVLVFLPGVGEIQQVKATLESSLSDDKILIAPLYGQLTSANQDAVIRPVESGMRKIVLATAIAETSLTIEGIRIVIDCGLMRVPRFDPNTGLTQLVTLTVSQASSEQRCGRAGRMEAGICYKLWSKGTHLLPYTRPEIMDADLVPLSLELAHWGVSDAQTLRWVDQPPAPHLAQASVLLQQLGALNEHGKITTHGNAMAQFGVHPRLAHMMLRGKAIGLGSLACEIAALISEREVVRGRQNGCDLKLRVEVLRGLQGSLTVDHVALRQVKETAKQWRRQLKVTDIANSNEFALIGVLLAFAYPDRIARQRKGSRGRFLLSNGRGAVIATDDALSSEEFIVAANLAGEREARIFLGAAIDKTQLHEYQNHLIHNKCFVEWDERNKCVEARQQRCIGELVVDDEIWQGASEEAIQQAFMNGIRTHGLGCLPWNSTAKELQARAIFAKQHDKMFTTDFSDADLIATSEEWLQPYLTGFSRLSHLKKLNLNEILLARLSWQQQCQLDKLAPTHITVPSGSRIRIDYTHSPPILAVRLQEVFGLAETPTIANGSVQVLLHLLSPARRPMQITQDLAGFWLTSYQEVKKEMKGRYPKHFWPDNPQVAEATSRVKRKR